MKKAIESQEPVPFKKGVRFYETFPVNVPFEKIDLYQWFTTMDDADYRSYSPAHKSLGSYSKDGKFYMVNVENVGLDMVVQNYELKSSSAESIKLYSPRTKAYIWRWFPVFVGVPWEFTLTRSSSTSCNLTCMIGTDYPNLLIRVAAWFNGLGGLFLKKHLKKEAEAFALDIQRKFQ